jgi:GT2 family glycosyltransferase
MIDLSGKPLVSIITVNYNQAGVTNELLRTLKEITYTNTEVIVVDNGSKPNDASEIAAYAPWAKVIASSTNLGFAGGNNLGLAEAKGDMLLFINNDVEVPAGFLEPLVEAAQQQGVGMVSPKIRFYHTPDTIQYAGSTPLNYITMRNRAVGFAEKDLGQHDLPSETAFAHGAAMLVVREVVANVGAMFDGYFLYYEELDWCERVKRAGYKIMYEPRSVVFHKESISTGKSSPLKTYYLNRNRLLFLKRNVHGLAKVLGIAYFLGVAFPKRLIQAAVTGQAQHRMALQRALLWHINPKRYEYVA